MKECTKCKEIKPLTEYYNHVKHGPRPACKACTKLESAKNWKNNKANIDKKNREWRAANPNKVYKIMRKVRLKRKYNITPETFDLMLKNQGNKCRICGLDQKDSGRIFVVDHSHKTGKVRSILCDSCNTALGLLKENPDTIESMRQYSIEFKEV